MVEPHPHHMTKQERKDEQLVEQLKLLVGLELNLLQLLLLEWEG